MNKLVHSHPYEVPFMKIRENYNKKFLVYLKYIIPFRTSWFMCMYSWFFACSCGENLWSSCFSCVSLVFFFHCGTAMPIIVMHPMTQNVIQGSTAQFSCEVTSIPRATITWYRVVDGVEESLRTGMPANVVIICIQVMDNSVTSNLVVMDSQLIDIANYGCRASHLESGITGMAASNTALLDIYGKCCRIENEDHMVLQHGSINL